MQSFRLTNIVTATYFSKHPTTFKEAFQAQNFIEIHINCRFKKLKVAVYGNTVAFLGIIF